MYRSFKLVHEYASISEITELQNLESKTRRLSCEICMKVMAKYLYGSEEYIELIVRK
jgi:uncharacterized UBP type Zn finger protein